MAEMMGRVAGRQPSGSGSGLMNMLGRPELWQWLGGVGAGMSRASRGQGYDISGANQQLFGAMRDRKQVAAFDMMMKQLPEGTFNPAQTNYLDTIKDYDAKMKVVQGVLFPDAKDPAVWEQKYNMNVEGGMSPRIAEMIQTGVYKKSVHPITGVVTVTDMSTGKKVDYGQGASTSAPVPPPPTPVDDGTPEDAVDYPAAFGLEGWWKNLWNTVLDYVVGGQIWPDAAAARRQFDNINAQTATLLAEGVDTRGGKYLLDRFDSIQARPGGIQGPEDALKTLKEMKGLLVRSYDVHKSVLVSRVKPQEASDATAAMRRLEPLIAEYEKIIGVFEAQFSGEGTAGNPIEMRSGYAGGPESEEINALLRQLGVIP